MSEVLRDLVVSLSLDGDNFSRNLTSINKQIQEAESEFKRAAAGVDGFEKSVAGSQSQLSTLQQKLNLQQKAVTQYQKAFESANKKLENCYVRQGKLTDALEKARQKNADLKSQVEAATKQYEKFARELSETDSSTVAAKANMDALAQEYSESAAEVKKLEGQLSANTKSLQNNADVVTKAKTQLNQAEGVLKETEAQIKKTTDQLTRMQSAWTKAGDALTTFGSRCAAVSNAMANVGRDMTMYITTPVLALGVAAVKASVEYESAFASVRKTVDATEVEYRELSDAAKQMSTEVATSASTIAEVMANAGQLGISKEYLVDFTRTMIDLGNSTDISADEAAVAIAQFANVTRMAQTDFGRFGSALVDLGNNFATTESAIMNMATRLAAAGSQVGLTQPQILGFATALSSVGLEAEAGGTAFSKAMIQMQVAVETGNDSLKDFAMVSGMTTDEFSALWKSDPAGAIQAFIVGLSKMDEQGISAIATLQEMGFTEVRLRDTLLRATNASDLFADAQETANSAWKENVALSEEASKRYATTESKLKNLKNTAVLAAQRIGDDLNPTIQKLIEGATELLEKFMALDEEQRLMIIKFAAVAAAAGPTITVFSKIVKTVGTVSTGLGKFSTAVAKAGGGWKGFASVLSKSPAVWMAVAAAVTAVTFALIDYVSGAKEAREAMEAMNDTAREWENHVADTIYNNDGLAAFGLTTDDFVSDGTIRTAEEWKDGLLGVWTDGLAETDEIIAQWSDSFAGLNSGMIDEMSKLRDDATATGHDDVAATIQQDIDTLEAMNAEIDALLKKRQGGYFTEADQLRLDELIDTRETIQVKYNLTPDGADGYDKILEGIETERARAFARGEKNVDTSVYEEGLTAAAQGHAAVQKSIDDRYAAEYAVIQLIEDEGERTAAQAELDAWYNAERTAAAQEYADVLSKIIMPVWEDPGIQKAGKDMDRLLELFREYSTVGSDGYQDPALLAEMNALTAGMNEDDVISYIGLLQQVQSLLDSGMPEEQVQAMFPELDITGNMDELAALADFAANHSGDLEGLSKILNELIPEEMQVIAVDLDLTKAKERWEEFSTNPGAITTDAIIGGYVVDESASVPQPVVDALVSAYGEVEGGASTVQLSPNEVVAEVSAYLEAEGCSIADLSPDQVTAIVDAYCEATGCDKSQLMQEFTATITAYDDTGAVKPELKIKVSITGYDLAAYNEFVSNNPVEVEGRVRLGEVYDDPAEVLEADNVRFYQDGQQIPIDVVPADRLTPDTLFILDADGTMHVLITPEIQGTPEALAAAEELLHTTDHQGSIAARWLDDNTLDDLEKCNDYLQRIDGEMNSIFNIGGWMNRYDRWAASETLSNYLDTTEIGNIQAYVAEAVAAINNGETLDADTVANLQLILELVELLDSIGIGENITAGIAEGMTAAGWDTDAETVAANLEAAINMALGIHSPAERMKPAGEQVAAGIGVGMTEYDLSADAKKMAASAIRTVEEALPQDIFVSIGEKATEGLADAISTHDMSAAGDAVASSTRTALGAALNSKTLRPVGINAMRGLVAGINAGRSDVIAAMRSAARAAVNAAKTELQIRSPSAVFENEVGVMTMRGFGVGVIKESKAQARVIANAARYLTSAAQGGVAGGTYDYRRTYNQNTTSTIQVDKLYVRDEQDIRSLAVEIATLTRRQQRGRGMRLA